MLKSIIRWCHVFVKREALRLSILFRQCEVGDGFIIAEDGYESVTDNPKSLEEVNI